MPIYIFISMAVVLILALICVLLIPTKKKVVAEAPTLSDGSDILIDGNGLLDYYAESGKDLSVYNSLAMFTSEYFDWINDYGVDSAYYKYYARELLGMFGYELSLSEYTRCINGYYSELGGSGRFKVEPVGYYVMGEYFLVEFDLTTSDTFTKYIPLTYTVYLDDELGGYRLLDFDIKEIYHLKNRFKTSDGDVPGANGLYFENSAIGESFTKEKESNTFDGSATKKD